MNAISTIIKKTNYSFKSQKKFSNNKFSLKLNIFFLCFIIIMISLIILILIKINVDLIFSNVKIKRKMNSDDDSKSEEDIKFEYGILGLIVIVSFVVSLIYIGIVILILRKNEAESSSYNLLTMYSFCIVIPYIIATSLIIDKVPSSEIGFLIFTYLALIPIIIYGSVKKTFFFCCKISMKEFFAIFYMLPCRAIFYIFKDSEPCCCSCYSFCNDICSGRSGGSSRTTHDAMVVIGYATSSGNNEGVNVRSVSVSSSSSDNCLCFLCEYCCIFIYFILIGPVALINTILYYIGLVIITVIICILFIFYIIPLLIAYLFSKCLCCKSKEGKQEDKLTYSYYCERNVAPLALTFVIIILIILSFLTVLIWKNISKIKGIFINNYYS